MDDKDKKVPFLKHGRIINPGLLTRLIGEHLKSEEKEEEKDDGKGMWR